MDPNLLRILASGAYPSPLPSPQESPLNVSRDCRLDGLVPTISNIETENWLQLSVLSIGVYSIGCYFQSEASTEREL